MLFTVLASLVLEGAHICGIQRQPTSVEDCKRICIENGCAGFTHFPNNTCIFFTSIRGAKTMEASCPTSYLFSGHGRCHTEYGYSKCMDNILAKSVVTPTSTVESKVIKPLTEITFNNRSLTSNVSHHKEEDFTEKVSISAFDQITTPASESIRHEEDVYDATILPSSLDRTIGTHGGPSIPEEDVVSGIDTTPGNISLVDIITVFSNISSTKEASIPDKEIVSTNESIAMRSSISTSEDISDLGEVFTSVSTSFVDDNELSTTASRPEGASIYEEIVESDRFTTVIDTSVPSNLRENITIIEERFMPIDSTSERTHIYDVYGNVTDSSTTFSIPIIAEEETFSDKVTLPSNITPSVDTTTPGGASAATEVGLPKEATGFPNTTRADDGGIPSNISTTREADLLGYITPPSDISVVNDTGMPSNISTSNETSVTYNITSACDADCIGEKEKPSKVTTSKEVTTPSKAFAPGNATTIGDTSMSSNISSRRGDNITDLLSTTTSVSQESMVTATTAMNETRSIVTPQPVIIADNVTTAQAINRTSTEVSESHSISFSIFWLSNCSFFTLQDLFPFILLYIISSDCILLVLRKNNHL